MRAHLLFLSLVLLVFSCSEEKPTAAAGPRAVVLYTGGDRYTVGDTVHVTVRNGTRDSVEVWQCCGRPRIFSQILQGSVWLRDTSTVNRCEGTCYDPLWLLPGQSAASYRPLIYTQPGQYRCILYLGRRGTWDAYILDTVFSNEFSVQ